MTTLRFDFRDIFHSTRLAFSLQRIWIQFVGLLVGYVGYLIFTILSFRLSDFSLEQIISRFGLFPCLLVSDIQASWLSKLVFVLGCIFWAFAILITNTAVSRASFMVLKGNNFYTWRQAFTFSWKKRGSIILTPIAIGLLVLSFLLGAWFIGLLGRIPYVGELGISLFTFLWISTSLFLIFLIVITFVAFILAPAIIATTNEDAFEAIFQSFSTAWSQPWRLIIYEGFISALSVAGFVILAFFVKRSFLLMTGLFSFSMGDDFMNIASHAQYLLQSWTIVLYDWLKNIGGNFTHYFFFARDFIPLDLSPTLTISSYVYAINMMFVGALVCSYLLATFNTGNMIAYLVLRRLKDDENLLERKDEEIDQEEEKESDEDLDKIMDEKEAEKETEDKNAETSENN